MLETMRARSVMTEFLDALAQDQARCDRLLEQAADALDSIERGETRSALRCAALLDEHSRLLTSHLVREDTLLRMQTAWEIAEARKREGEVEVERYLAA